MIFGEVKFPLNTKKGFIVGVGTVYPGLNFTLPIMKIDDNEIPKIKDIYRSIIVDACVRALELVNPCLVVEYDTLIENDLRSQLYL